MNIACDPAQLELVLLNLAVNASDSMPEGGVLTLETRLAAHNGAAQVTLTVVDTGAGMDSETLRRCLELFFTTKPVGEGVGLGLRMAFGFMEQTGGKLQSTSEPVKGTRVSLVFPQAEHGGNGGLPLLSVALVGGDELVLLIEDEPGVCEHVRGVLAGLGHRVAACETADAAIG